MPGRPAYIAPAMATPFLKMHGLGNDFVVFDARAGEIELSETQVRRLADRNSGIGCDQLVRLEPSSRADVFMRIWNSSGEEVGACGNVTRCVATLLGGEAVIETLAGLLPTQAVSGGAIVDMGAPRFEWDAIPLAYPMDTREMPVGWETLDKPGAANVGNPHVVFFIEDLDAVPLADLGPVIETDPLFPERVNVNVAEIVARDRIRLNVWERGAGLTRACGTGACATVAVAIRRGLTDRRVAVELPGGELAIVQGDDGRLWMTGDAALAFRGSVDLAAYA